MSLPPPSYLAFDLGASSGRAVVGAFHDGAMRMTEVHRFTTPLAEREAADGRQGLFWDLEAIWTECLTGLGAACQLAPGIRSVSVDTWAVDYVPVGSDGQALRDPYAYRDLRTEGRTEQAFARVSPVELYARTGIQPLPFNTAFQVLDDVEREPGVVAMTVARMLLADYLLFRLAGRASGACIAERTVASSTGLLDVRTGDWDRGLIRALGLPDTGWPEVTAPGTRLGRLDRSLLPDTWHGERPIEVVATCSHDTAAAVATVPVKPGTAYVSSGTWALVGTTRAEPVLTDAARRAGFTNESGLDGTVRLLKNRVGFWVLEECLREWGEAPGGYDRPDYEQLVREAAAAPVPARTIDLDAPAFASRGSMVQKVVAASEAAGVSVSGSRGALVRLLLESQAEAVRETLAELEALTGSPVERLQVVGGGARNALLCQLTADACGLPVTAGPAEATALGNLIVQARAMGDLPDGLSLAALVARSARCTPFAPSASQTPA